MDNFNSNYTKFEDQDDSLYMSVEEDNDNINYASNDDDTNNNSINDDINNNSINDATKGDANKFNTSINRQINESSTFRSINLQEPTDNHHDIWSPNFDNSWNLPKKKSYYDTEKMSDSIDETKESLKKNLINLNERKSKLNNIESISDMLDVNAAKFQSNSRKLKYEIISKYAFHTICIVLLIIFIITLIVIIVKS